MSSSVARTSFSPSRRLPAVALVVALLAILSFPTAASASATPFDELQALLDSCFGDEPMAATLLDNIDASTSTLTVSCNAVLKLNDHVLGVQNVVIEAGRTLTVEGEGTLAAEVPAFPEEVVAAIRTTDATLIILGGTVHAVGGRWAAGIGGDWRGSGGTLEVADGTVIATGGEFGAGVGSGGDALDASGGTVKITGGTVAATGGLQGAAGIGGGSAGDGGTVSIAGGMVEATGGGYAAGIGGGGWFGDGGTVTIAGGMVEATGGEYAAGIGGGYAGDGGTVTVAGDGIVEATGGEYAAGIGGGEEGAGAKVTIAGGTVEATGGEYAAGIGGGWFGDGGEVVISDGDVTATGSQDGAGMGGGYSGFGGMVTVSGGKLTATGGSNAAGIGGGSKGRGGTVDVGAGAVVTAAGGSTAIGAGDSTSLFGSLAVAGTLRLPSGDLRIPSGSTVTVAGSGHILGGTADPTVGANFVGTGRIANGGVIALDASHVTDHGVTVSGRHYEVGFDVAGDGPTPENVVVFAPSFETGMRSFPTDPARDDGLVFIGWTDQPHGAGNPFTTTSVLPGSSEDGKPVEVTAHAYWSELSLDSGLTDDTATITAGENTTFTPTMTDSNDQPYQSDPKGWKIGGADGLVTATIDPETGQITLTSTTAGTYPLQLDVLVGDNTLTTSITLHVEAALSTVLHLEVASTTIAQGGTATITVTGTDEHDNPTGDITDEVTFTSDVATDVIDGSNITFPTASPHTITATHTSGATATLTFDITPTATDDDPTDDDPTDDDTATEDDTTTEDGGTSTGNTPTGDGAPFAAPGPVPSDESVQHVTAVPSPDEGPLPATGANPLGLLSAALLTSLAGTLLLRRSATRHQASPVT